MTASKIYYSSKCDKLLNYESQSNDIVKDESHQ